MDQSTDNLRLSLLLLLVVISSFSLLAQEKVPANNATLNTNRGQTNTTQLQSNTFLINGRLDLQSSTTDIHQVREIPRGGLQVDNGSIYNDNNHTSASDDHSSNSSQTNTIVNCPMMYVQVNLPFLQSCIQSSAQINFCNNGTTSAFGAFVDVELPAELLLDSADLAYTVVGPNLYRFQLGTVAISFCDQFEIYFTTDCDSTIIGEEHCIHAHIYPDTLCNSVQNTPLLTVDGACVAGKTTFTLNNHGTAVTAPLHMQLIIIEDHLLVGGTPPTYYNDTLVLERGGTFTPGFITDQNGYKLQLKDSLGNVLVQSRVNECYLGSTDLFIENFHAQQQVNQFGNAAILPSISQGCAINGYSAAQTNSTFAPSAPLKPNGTASASHNNSFSLDFLEAEATTVLVFPNPFSQYATVRIEGPISDRFMFRLYDATGRTVQMMEIEGQREFQIKRGNLLQGMYLYQIESEGHLIDAGKLIIK
jgi:hypothetical protein